MLLSSWRRFGVHRDDFWVVTSKSVDELMRDNFWGITGKLNVEPMLSCNQLKVGESFAETTTEVKLVQKF